MIFLSFAVLKLSSFGIKKKTIYNILGHSECYSRCPSLYYVFYSTILGCIAKYEEGFYLSIRETIIKINLEDIEDI